MKVSWAVLRDDKKINPVPDLSVDVRPSGASAVSEGPGADPFRKIAQGTKNHPRRPILRPIREHVVICGSADKTDEEIAGKYQVLEGQPAGLRIGHPQYMDGAWSVL